MALGGSVADVYLALRVDSKEVKKDIERGAKEAKTEQAGKDAGAKFGRGFRQEATKELRKAGSGIGGIGGEITGIGGAFDAAGRKGSIFARVLGGIGAATSILEPAVSALAVATGAMAGAAVAAGAGLGAYGLVLKEVGQELKKMKQLQTAAATGNKAAQKSLQDFMKTTTPAFRAFAGQLDKTKLQYTDWGRSLQQPVLGPLTDALKVVGPALKDLSPLVKAASVAVGQLVDAFSARIAEGGLKEVVATLLPHVVPVITGLGKAVGNVAAGLWGLVKAFLPFTDNMVGGIVRITQKFKDWASDLRSHSGFQALISQWRTVWPEMRKGLMLMLEILTNILGDLAGMTTGGNSRALWIALNPILAITKELSSHPVLIRLIFYLLALGKVSKQVGGVFTALKSGWGAVTKFLALVTGGKVQLGMQSAGDTMLLAAKQMQAAADTMAGAGVKGGAVGAAEGAAGGAAGKLGKGAGLASLARFGLSLGVPIFAASQFKLPGQAKTILANDVDSFKKSFIDPIAKLWHLVMPADKLAQSAGKAAASVAQAGKVVTSVFGKQQKAAKDSQTALDNYTAAIYAHGLASQKTWKQRDQLVKDMMRAGVSAGKANGDVDKYTDAIKRNGYGSAQARKARQNLVTDITNAFKASQQGRSDMGKYTDAVRINGRDSDVAKAARAKLIKDLESSGLTSKEARRLVNNLTDSIKNIPTHHSTTVSVLGKGSGLLAYKLAVPHEMTAKGTLEFHAAGGLVRGRGFPTADANLIAASRGEYVQKAAAVAQYGVPAMDAINAGRAVVGYANGGMVGLANEVGKPVPWMSKAETTFARAAEDSWGKAAMRALAKAVQAAVGTVGWPFPHKSLSQLRRIDEGQDMQYPGTSPVNVYAILPGRRVTYTGDPGGFGNAYPGEVLDRPAMGFKQIYYGHVRPAGRAGHVAAGEVIGRTMGPTSGGDAAGLPNWLELGFWPPSWANGPAMHELLLHGTSGGAGSKRGGNWTVGGMARLWDQAGGNPRVAHLMGAIGMAESGGRAWIINSIGATGLWQIYGKPFPGDATNPQTNARMAVSKYRSQGLGAWEAYTNGSYRQFMGKGGLITEPTLGIGLHSGRQIVMGERGAEQVVPHDSITGLTAAVRALHRDLLRALGANAADTGRAVADALNGAARRASYSGAYSVR